MFQNLTTLTTLAVSSTRLQVCCPILASFSRVEGIAFISMRPVVWHVQSPLGVFPLVLLDSLTP